MCRNCKSYLLTVFCVPNMDSSVCWARDDKLAVGRETRLCTPKRSRSHSWSFMQKKGSDKKCSEFWTLRILWFQIFFLNENQSLPQNFVVTSNKGLRCISTYCKNKDQQHYFKLNRAINWWELLIKWHKVNVIIFPYPPVTFWYGSGSSYVKFLMLFKGSLLPPLTDLLSRIKGSGPQKNASFWTILII